MSAPTEAERKQAQDEGRLDGWGLCAQYAAAANESEGLIFPLSYYMLGIARAFADDVSNQSALGKEYWIGLTFAFGSFIEGNAEEREQILALADAHGISRPRRFQIVR